MRQRLQSANDGSRAGDNGFLASDNGSCVGDDKSRAGDDGSQVRRMRLRPHTPVCARCPFIFVHSGSWFDMLALYKLSNTHQ